MGKKITVGGVQINCKEDKKKKKHTVTGLKLLPT